MNWKYHAQAWGVGLMTVGMGLLFALFLNWFVRAAPEWLASAGLLVGVAAIAGYSCPWVKRD